ncbi:YceI family protein [Pleomorphovibrio marinus]|uniref:YceI family protein n=1 Tax=Pleomorphovibrio marinus TaxID=2164132 RepID=UPI000E0B9AF9|nr:YceI family protein [Pleomorphovibrio marinus]
MIGYRWVLFIALLVSFGLNANAQTFKTENGQAEFLSKASLLEFTGESDQLQGLIDLDKNLLDFYLDLNTLKTGVGLRDRHMRDNYLETKKFPFAEFTGEIEEGTEIPVGQTKNVTAKGKFKIHGVEREIVVPGTLKRNSANEMVLDASFKVLLEDYDIEIPRVVFYELAEEQEVTIHATLRR